MAEDFPVEGLTIKDDTRYDRNVGLVKERVYTFYLGKHGPFIERVPLDGFDEHEIQRRVDQIRAHLTSAIR